MPPPPTPPRDGDLWFIYYMGFVTPPPPKLCSHSNCTISIYKKNIILQSPNNDFCLLFMCLLPYCHTVFNSGIKYNFLILRTLSPGRERIYNTRKQRNKNFHRPDD